MKSLIYQDLVAFAHGPKVRDKVKVLLLSPGFYAVMLIRMQASLYEHNLLLFSYFIQRLNLMLHGIDVLPGAIFDGGLKIEHPVGIVVGASTKVGKNCTILQGVTLGSNNVVDDSFPNSNPRIGDNVVIGANSSILGNVIIGNNVHIGAHTLVLTDLPAGFRAIGGTHK
jgi:serine O-acetyltransferase